MLRLHRSERADRLVDALAGVLADPLNDPFEAEVVAVPARGIERWLTQQLSLSLGASAGRMDGVCANVDFPSPGRLAAAVTAAATGVDREDDPWLPERAVWPLLEVVDANLDEAWLAPVAAHLAGRVGRPEGGDGATHRFTLARRVTDLFDRYWVHRPEMVRQWVAGHDTDGDGGLLPPDAAWQAALFRSLRRHIDVESPAERLDTACGRLRDEPALVDLPPHLSLFGLTRLPASHLAVLNAIGARREVHLFVLHPSRSLWDRIAELPDRPPAPRRRRQDLTAAVPRNPLLATWGRDAREVQTVLMGSDEDRTDEHHPLTSEPTTLLHRLQDDVRSDRAPPGVPTAGSEDRRAFIDADDRSIQVHACHGRERQVEALRDAILHLLADDPTLQPRDVIVMCPDIDAYAPLISATFGERGRAEGDDHDDGDTEPGMQVPSLHVRLADRSPGATNPVLAAMSEVLELTAGRVTASQVLDFASREPVRRRFRLDDDDLARVQEWTAAAGVRWGFDAVHRAPYKLDALEVNTWKSGLDRLLLGVSMAEEDLRLVGDVLPLDDVDSGDIDLAGRLAELVDRLSDAVDALSGPKPVDAWAAAIAGAAAALTATSERDSWQQNQLERILDEVVAESTAGPTTGGSPLALGEVQALLADRLRPQPTRANFRTGHLTMCTLVPMRSVPHRVVCLLGLDDGVFPRQTASDGDDLVQRAPRVGDHDARSEDRQLLLDALLAATDHLVVTYAGRDERTNASRPPAVPVGELLDVVEATARTERGTPVREQVVVHHPLQPFDARNFTAGALAPDRHWSFDAVALDGARASLAPRAARPPFLLGALPAATTDVIELDDLVRFVQHPVKAFLRQRLGVVVRGGDDEPADAMPVALDALDAWGVGERLVDARLAGTGAATCVAAEVARGALPPGALGARTLDDVMPIVERIVSSAVAVQRPGAERRTVTVAVEVGGRSVVGTVPDVLDDLLRSVTYSRLGPKHRLTAWVRLLALTAADSETAYRASSIGRGGGEDVDVASISPLGDHADARHRAALHHLGTLVDLYDRGMREPLPIYAKTSAAYAEARRAGRNPTSKGRDAWGSRKFDNEDREPEHVLVMDGVVPFDRLLDAVPADGEAGTGWADAETTRFGRCAVRLWRDLLAHEQISSP